MSQAEQQDIFAQQKYLFWKEINAARQNPLAVLERLDISEEQAREALGAGAWILDTGLSPLAWNDQLKQATFLHGRDMLGNLYYSHVSPDGAGPRERIAATGYQAMIEDESLALLIFSDFVSMERAVTALVDNLLRDELTAVEGVHRNIFSPVLTEMGISFFGEYLPALDDTPFVYLVVLDFARPMVPATQLIGVVGSGMSLGFRFTMTGFWDFLPLLPGDSFQLKMPVGGGDFVVFDSQHQRVNSQSIIDDGSFTNRFVDLR